MAFDYAKRRAELQAAMDLNSLKQAELASEMREHLKEFRELELQQHAERTRLKRINPPTGVHK